MGTRVEATPYGQWGPRASERSETLDAVRASALIGVIAINMLTIAGLGFLNPADLAAVQGPVDRLLAPVLAVLVEGKALAAFSLLFGLSFSILLEGATRRHEPFRGFFTRRLAVLGVLGVINALVFYWGDILTTYAVLGALLPFAARLSQAQVLRLALVLIAVPPGLLALAGLEPAGQPGFTRLVSLVSFREPSLITTIDHNWALFTGAVGAQDGLRLWRYATIGGLFLLGLHVGRSGLLHHIDAHSEKLTRIAVVGLAAGLLLEVARVSGLAAGPLATVTLVGKPMMGVGYLALGALVLSRPWAARARAALSPLGRMALTGYLMGGFLGQAVFYGWGLGLIGSVGTAGVLAWAAAIAALLAVFAHAWLGRYRYGPWEWLWRWLSRLERPAMRLR